jgi:putative peptidoglycan lipid II flippase
VDDATQAARHGTRLGTAAVLLASSALLSRVLGYLREAVLAYRVGAGAATDAYYAAFQIPDLLNYLLAGGALSIAFLPLYARHQARGDAEGAEHLFATVLGGLGAVTVVLTAALWWYAEPLVALQFPRFDPATQVLTVHLTRIVLPAQIFFITGGIINATLLARNRFGAAAAAPLLYNGATIAGGLFLAPRLHITVEGFAWGALAGGILGPFLAPLIDARGRVRVRVRLALSDRAFLAYLAVAAPLMFGQTLLTVDEWYGRWFGALLGTGTVAHLGYARRLMLVPVAVVGQSIAAAALPTLSRLWAEGRHADLDRVVLRTLQAGLGLAVFGAAAFYVFSPALVRVFYQHGAFNVADSASVAAILAVLALAIPAWIVQQIAARAFYARGDTWRPMLLGTIVAVAAIPLYLLFGRRFGVLGLAAAGVIGMSVNAFATVALARRLHGAPDLTTLLSSAARAAIIAGVAAFFATRLPGGATLQAALLQLVAGGAIFAVVITLGVFTIADQPVRDALRRLLRRIVPFASVARPR